MLYDTGRLFLLIVRQEVVAVPFFDGWSVTPLSAIPALGAWAVGLIAIGWRRTQAGFGWLAPVGVTMSGFLDQQTFVSSIMYVVAVALAMHWWSARLARQERRIHLVGVPLRVLQTLISIIFAWTAIGKLNPRFLSGALLSVSFTGPIPVPEFVLDHDILALLAVGTIMFEGAVAVGLWMPRVRSFALAGILVFHLTILAFFGPTIALAAFALAMGSGYVLFVAEPWARTVRLSE